MDFKLKAILDEFLPYTDDEYPSVEKWEAKTALRKRLADAILVYKEYKHIAMPGINVDMIDVIKKMTGEN